MPQEALGFGHGGLGLGVSMRERVIEKRETVRRREKGGD
jgi:hypothetical protein